jgi:hypothetical protein
LGMQSDARTRNLCLVLQRGELTAALHVGVQFAGVLLWRCLAPISGVWRTTLS